MNEGGQNGVKDLIEAFTNIFRQKSQYEVAILLQQDVFPTVTPIRFGISQMLRAVQFDSQTTLGT